MKQNFRLTIAFHLHPVPCRRTTKTKTRMHAAYEGPFHLIALFFLAPVVDAPVLFGAASVVVIVITIGGIVVPAIADPGMVAPKIVAVDTTSTIDFVTTIEPDTSVEMVDSIMTVSETTLGEIVDGGMVEGGIVVPGNVAVYVNVIALPRALAGITDPTPEAVNWLGIGSVAVLGAETLEYILPVDPFTSVYWPDTRLAKSPIDELYAPPT